MFDKIRGLAFAVATIGLMASAGASNATVVSISDAGNDFELAPFSTPLTLDNGAVDTAAFDTTSTQYSFLGIGAGSQTFTLVNNGINVLSIGNIITDATYAVALVTVAGTVIDLLATPDTNIIVNVPGEFTISTYFVMETNAAGDDLAGTYDFTISAVPVPAAGFLLLVALGGLGFAGRRRRKAA